MNTWNAEVGEPALLSLSDILTLEGDYTYAVDLRETARFARYDELLRMITIAEGVTTSTDVGTYVIAVTIVYADGHITEYLLELVLT